MTNRQQNGSGNLIAIFQHQEKAQAKKIGINKIKDLIDSESFRNELDEILGYAKREKSKGGRPTFDPVFMFKIVILQKYYGLSDDATEEQIEDRASFMGFLDLKVGVQIPDAKTKLIINYSNRHANVHDSQEFQSLVNESDPAVLADSAYSSEASEAHLHQCECEEFFMKKGKRGTPLSETEQQANKKISRIRVRVERIFGLMKQKGMDYVKSIGLNRAHQT
jgi:IS5 family transposase